MIIRNFNALSANSEKQDVLAILEAGLEAAMPGKHIEKIVRRNHLIVSGKKIDLKKYDNVFVVAVGKAAYAMAESVDSLIDVKAGLLVVPNKTRSSLLRRFKVIQAGHPLPNKNSMIAAKKIIEFVDKVKPHDYVIFLISGGTSSLVALPDDGITLREKRIVTDLMLRCGATIHEINCIRKHLSKIKGGRLMEHLRSDGISLILSDVVGDDLSSIASGITYYDETTFLDAKDILEKYHLERSVPKSMMQRINLGMEGKIPETPKRPKIRNYIVSTNDICLDVMEARAKGLGFSTKILRCLSGDVKDLSAKITKIFSDKKTNCIIFGGESTVVVKGKGKGGRNQELVLYTIINLVKQGIKATVASVGTDGIDGKTDCAGAIYQTGQKTEVILNYLNENNSYRFFKKYGGLVITGPTGTNLMDIGLVIRTQ
jgi:glycerate 2-kinase